MNKKIFVWSHADLDGVGSILVLKWFFESINYEIEYKVSTSKKFREDILKWLLTNNFSDYKYVYICDLDIHKDKEIIDQPNVIIIDHHKSHAEWINSFDDPKQAYHNANIKDVKEYSSASQLALESYFIQQNNLPTKYRQLLIKLIDDYDSFALKYKQSRELNILFWSNFKDRDKKFIELFNEGFKGFDKFQQYTIDHYEEDLKNFIDNMQIYESVLNIFNKPYKCASIMANKMIDDLAAYLLSKEYDLAFIVNVKTMSVSVRKNKNCDLSLNDFITKLGGGGHEFSGGCPLSDQFQLLLKKFNKVPK